MSPATARWVPSDEQVRASRLWQFLHSHGLESYAELCAGATRDPRWFWDAMVKDLGIVFTRPYDEVMDTSAGIPFTRWFVGGQLNAYDSAVVRHRHANPASGAVIAEVEGGAVRRVTYV